MANDATDCWGPGALTAGVRRHVLVAADNDSLQSDLELVLSAARPEPLGHGALWKWLFARKAEMSRD